jgi:hypothetical protein
MRLKLLLITAFILPVVTKAQTQTLPFTIKVTEEKIDSLPDYMGPNNPVDMDFPYCPVMIDGEYWVIYKNGYHEPVYRYKGTNIENAVRQPDGSITTPLRAAYFLGGMWYDPTEKKLYAPIHDEANPYATNVERQIHLASSNDKGLTWKYEGLLIGRDNPVNSKNPAEFSGLFWDGSDGDHHLFVDKRSGYIYLYTIHWITTKVGLNLQYFMRFGVARCAISDKMAPGKWWKFYNGNWNEPGVGGKISYVNAYRVTYNNYLQKYISINFSSGISVCDDISKQEWSPSFCLGNFWNMGITANALACWVTDSSKTNLYTSGQNMFVYNFLRKQPGFRYGVKLGKGTTTPDGGFVSSTSRFSIITWGCEHKISMNPGQQYPYEPLFESADPIESRRTRRVGSLNPEVRYKGAWTDHSDSTFYEGKSKNSAIGGNSIEFSFRGKDIYWRASQGPDQGKADVSIDGIFQKTVDLWASEASVLQFAFIKQGLKEDALHTIKVVVKNEKNALSKGTAINHLLFEYSADTYRASDCFSSIKGKNNWYYLQKKAEVYTDLTFKEPNWTSPDSCKISYFTMKPGIAKPVRKWVAPHSGYIRMEAAISCNSPTVTWDPVITYVDNKKPNLVPANSGKNISVKILKNKTELLSISLINKGIPSVYDIYEQVKEGDSIYFTAE